MIVLELVLVLVGAGVLVAALVLQSDEGARAPRRPDAEELELRRRVYRRFPL